MDSNNNNNNENEAFSGASESSEFRKIVEENENEREFEQSNPSPPEYSNYENKDDGINLETINPNISLDNNNNNNQNNQNNQNNNNNNNNQNNNIINNLNKKNKKRSTFKNRIDFSFKDINHYVQITEKGKKKKISKQILTNINGHIESGTIFAIMGPSGAGKTTLLDILAHRLNINGSGTMYLNGNKSDFNIFKKLCGYVTQSDSLMPSLTVRETLNFYAQLKMPRDVPLKEKLQRVQDIIDEMGLNRCADTLVGTADNKIRGISGGERRRVTISIELLTGPSVILLDEPTSGLDASTSFYVMSALKKLAKSGRTIICTIHQPRSNIYDMFDNLLLLGDGNTIYYGKANKALEYFNANGYHCSEKTNPADFFLDLINTQVEDQADSDDDDYNDEEEEIGGGGGGSGGGAGGIEDIGISISPTMNGSAVDNIKNNELKQQQQQQQQQQQSTDGRARRRIKKLTKEEMVILKKEYPNSEQGLRVNETLDNISKENRTDFKYEKTRGPNFLTQFSLLLGREVTNAKRHPMAFKVNLIQAIFQGLLCGIVYYQLGLGQSSVQSRTGVVAFIIMGVSFPAVMSTIHVFPDVITIFLKDRASGVYDTLPFFLAKSFMDACIAVLLPMVTATIVYWMTNQRVDPFYSAAPFFRFVLMLVLASQTCLSLGVLISSSVPNVQVGTAVAPLIVILFFLFSGFFINLNDVPGWLVWFPYISFFRYMIEAAVINAFKDVHFTCTDSQKIGGVCPVQYGNNVIENMGYDIDHFWRNVWILVLYIIGFRVLTFLVLKLKSRNKFKQE
ncbi:ABC transporter G family protein [Dictyostelium discoideum AX4]|uniref:ABC transporter G family member 1 n=1 Tax=Dictyostelium discoideum TaxID=44689 RepID=ABCG1_DICDI|nr:ABC transporter G family protein [Dictyostelium discoideum AX4]Q55DW4.1 RecName: Full=ABC transporter G family member 1; AltName: Full=ABC transporter ABCG.1 [Dictyostelium discoideum]EAL71957.1 ABC transporter G family protein [Dictyostelium discoideum AX4]|eukprot:XP_646017.1 ABC transporter G family protein [Dictyostelium discoideum AX4]